MDNKQPEKSLLNAYLSYGRENLILAYILFFISPIFPPFFFIAGLVVFLRLKDEEKNSFLGSHYNFLFQTFWKAIVAYIICTLLFILAIGVILRPLLTILLFIRLAFGLKFLINQQAHPNPDTNWIK
ncbi:MAG: hypothetical protein K0Q51_778 [Rickettsiaceae bacterium]|jgi:uncharacterized membrane protein|nr:hypothetical protein [Rickettsiaceae bacterium]